MGNTSIASLSNQALWERWKVAIDEWALDHRNRNLKEKVDRLENEIVCRLSAVGHRDFKCDFVGARPGRKRGDVSVFSG